MGYNSRRAQQVLLLPPKKRKLRLQQLSPKTGSGCFYWALFKDHRHMYTTTVSQKTHKFHLLLYFLKYLNEKSAQTSEYWTTCYCWEVVLQYCAGPYTAIHIIWYTSCIKSNHIFSSLLDYPSLQEVTSLLKWLPSCNELLLLARKSGPDFNKVTLNEFYIVANISAGLFMGGTSNQAVCLLYDTTSSFDIFPLRI